MAPVQRTPKAWGLMPGDGLAEAQSKSIWGSVRVRTGFEVKSVPLKYSALRPWTPEVGEV